MASFDDLFNSKTSKFPKWENEGDVVVGVVHGEIDVHHQQIDFATKKPAFLVKTGTSETSTGWESKGEGTFDTELQHFPLTELRVPVEIQVQGGENYDSFFDFPHGTKKKPNPKTEALKLAMLDTGLGLVDGTVIAMKLLSKASKPYTWKVGIRPPASE